MLSQFQPWPKAVRLGVTLFATGLLAACGAPTNGSFGDTGSPQRGSANEIVSAELREAEVTYNTAFEIVRELRPSWLRVRNVGGGDEPVVYLDRIRFGRIDSLMRLAAPSVERMVFISGLNATTIYGTGHGAGVIEVYSR